MITIRHLPVAALWAACVIGPVGCESPPAPAPAASASTAPPATASTSASPQGPRGRGAGPGRQGQRRREGPEMMVKLALRKLELSDEQRTKLEALHSEERGGGGKREREASRAALAEAVRAGKLDVDALAKGQSTKHDAMVAQLDKLHATLTDEQRQELVATMRERGARGRRGGDEPGDRRALSKRSALNKLLAGLEVSDDQRRTIDEALEAAKLGPDREGGGSGEGKRKERRRAALLEAFTQADFSAVDALGEPERAKHRRYLERLAVVVPLLDEAQRGRLAERIAEGRGKRKRGR